MKNKKRIAEEILKGDRVVIFIENDACISIKKPKDFIEKISYYKEDQEYALKENLTKFIGNNIHTILSGSMPHLLTRCPHYIILYGVDDKFRELGKQLQEKTKITEILNISMINVDKMVSTMETVELNKVNVEGFLDNYEVIYKNFTENCCKNH